MKVKSFTVSTSFDVHHGGSKSNHFLSANIEMEEPMDIDDLPRAQLLAGYKVYVATVYDALLRGSISIEESNDRIKSSQNAYELIQIKLDEKAKLAAKEKAEK